MYLSSRSIRVRNISIAVANGIITLVILLIAPLGLAAVIINTLLVTIATYATATIGDRVIRYLHLDTPLRAELMPPPGSEIERQTGDIERHEERH